VLTEGGPGRDGLRGREGGRESGAGTTHGRTSHIFHHYSVSCIPSCLGFPLRAALRPSALACAAAEKAGYVHVRPPVVLSGYAASCGRTLAIRTVTCTRNAVAVVMMRLLSHAAFLPSLPPPPSLPLFECILVRACDCALPRRLTGVSITLPDVVNMPAAARASAAAAESQPSKPLLSNQAHHIVP
jgi:hypothetical protein